MNNVLLGCIDEKFCLILKQFSRMTAIVLLSISTMSHARITNIYDSKDNRFAGLYFGAQLGEAWGYSNNKTTIADNGTYFIPLDSAQIAAAGRQGLNPSTLVGGFFAGYNSQIDKLVFGLQLDMDSLRFRRSENTTAIYLESPSNIFTIHTAIDADWLFLLRPRVGYAINDLLFYSTAGFAVTNIHNNFKFNDNFANGAIESASGSKKYGWNVGAGVEFKLTHHWIIKGEYLFVDFGRAQTSGVVINTNSTPPSTETATLAHRLNMDMQLATVGVTYKFGDDLLTK